MYFVLLTQLNNGQTLGKKLFRIKVISSDGRHLTVFGTIYRETVGRYLTGLLCIGYIVAGALSTKQGFHDMLADTYVVYDFDDAPLPAMLTCKPDENAHIFESDEETEVGQ